MRKPTNYPSLVNRCPDCGHRTILHGEKGCHVVTNAIDRSPDNDKPCTCKRVYND